MSQNKIDPNKFTKLLGGWEQEYRKKQEKAQLATTYTRSQKSKHKKKFPKVKFLKKQGHLKFNMEFKVYTDQLVFGESRKIFDEIQHKKIKVRDNDEMSEEEDIEHAVQKGIRRLTEQIMVKKMQKLLEKRQQKLEKKKIIHKLEK